MPTPRPGETAAATGEPPLTVTVSDDGSGIADPAVLLSFGENGWDDALVRREDAAGFGFASLARRNCAVSSRPRSRTATYCPAGASRWNRRIFSAKPRPRCRPTTRPRIPAGRRFRSRQPSPPPRSASAAGNAARHYPLPVVFEDRTDGDAPAEELPRRAFLDGAVHAERWRGLVFGVFRNRHCGYRDPDLNFFGLTLTVGLPTVETVHGPAWTVLADVDDCPDLELVLPARKEAVENAFLEEMREAARLAIYRAMAADPNPRPSFEDRKRAHEADIDIAPPPPVLRPWRPGTADVEDWRDPPKLAQAGEDALIMDCDPEPPEAQTLWRAAERGGIAPRLFEADRRLEGYAWYDAIERVIRLRTEVTAGRRPYPLDKYPVPERTGGPVAPLPQRPDAIRLGLTVRTGKGVGRMVDLAADLAFAGEAWSWVGDALPLVTASTDLEPWQLAQIMRAAFFSPSDDADADSWERQRDVFDQEALHIATKLLVSDDEARRTSIADAVARELFWLIPHDRGVDIAVRDRKVTVTLAEPAGEAAP